MTKESEETDLSDSSNTGFMNILLGHSSLVKSITYFPALSEFNKNHDYIITGSEKSYEFENRTVSEGEFIMWNLQTYERVKDGIWYGHSKSVCVMAALSRDVDREDFLISGSQDGVIIIWKFNNPSQQKHKNKQYSPFSKLIIIAKAHSDKGVKKLLIYSPPKIFSNKEGLNNYLFTSLGGDGVVKVWKFDMIIKNYNSTNINETEFIPKIFQSKLECEDSDIVTFLSYGDKRERGKDIVSQDSNILFPFLGELQVKNIRIRDVITRKQSILQDTSTATISDNKIIKRKGDKLSSIALYIPTSNCIRHCNTKNCTCTKPLILAGWNNRILIFDLATLEVIFKKTNNNIPEKVLFFIGHTKEVTALCVYDPSDILFDNNRIKVKEKAFSRQSSNSTFCIRGEIGESREKIYSPLLISGSKDGTIIIWDLLEMTKIRKIPIENFVGPLSNSLGRKLEKGHSGKINCISVFDYSIYDNSPQIVSSSNDNKLVIWDLLSGQLVRTISGGHIGAVVDIEVTVTKSLKNDNNKVTITSFSNDSSTACKGDNCIVWDLSAIRIKPHMIPCESEITALKTYQPRYDTNKSIIIAAHKNGIISFWDIIQTNFQSIGYIFKRNETSAIISMDIHPLDDSNGFYDILIVTCHGNLEDGVGKTIQLTKVNSNEIVKSKSIIIKMKLNVLCLQLIPIPLKDKDPILYLIIGSSSPPKKDENNENNDFVPIKMLQVDLVYEKENEEKENELMRNYDKVVIVKKSKKILTLEEDKSIKFEYTIGDHNHICNIRCLTKFSNVNDAKNNIVYLVTGSDDKCVMVWKLSMLDDRINIVSKEFEGPLLQQFNGDKSLKFNDSSIKLELSLFETKRLKKPKIRLVHNERVRSIIVFIPVGNMKYHNPIIISGCYDNNIYLWDSKTGEKLIILSGHTEVITSISIFDHPDCSVPLLISASRDKTINVWKLPIKEGKHISESSLLRKMIGHNDEVNSVIVNISIDCKPILLSGGLDKTLIVWEHSLDLVQSMPTQQEVLRGFKLDFEIKDNHCWPMMRKLTDEYGLGLWIENAGLFFVALRKKQLSFFILFKRILVKVLRHTWWIPKRIFRKNESEGVTSLLMYALEKMDFQIIDIILDCLLENINEDITDPLSQRLFHFSYLVNQEDLLNLSIKHPALFIKFISGIKLIKTDGMLNKTNTKLNIKQLQSYADSSSKHLVDAYSLNNMSDMWKIILDNNSRSKCISIYVNRIFNCFKFIFTKFSRGAIIYSENENINRIEDNNDEDDVNKGRPVTSKYLPLLDAGSIAILDRCVNVSLDEKSRKIFETVVGQTVLDYLWRRYAFFSHFCQTVVYLLYVILYSYLIYRFHTFSDNSHNKSQRDIAWTLELLLLVWTVLYLFQEFYQIYYDTQKYDLYEKPYKETEYNNQSGLLLYFNKANSNNDFYSNNSNICWNIILGIKDFLYGLIKFCQSLVFHFCDIWKFNNLVITSLVLTATIKRLINLNNKSHINEPFFVPIYYSSSLNSFPTSYPTSEPSMTSSSIQQVDSADIRCLYAVATICVYFKILYFLRPFPHYGPLVSIILRVAKDILRFLSILLLIMCAFAQTYWILNENTKSLFGTSIWKSYLYSFLFMLGQSIDPNTFNDSANFPLNILLLAFFMIFMILLMLNLLIALMNDSYRVIKENSLAQWRLEQGGIILDDPFVASVLKNQKNHFIYTLNYSSVSDINSSNKNESKVTNLFENWQQSFCISNKEIINIILEFIKRDEIHFFFSFERDDSEDQMDVNQQLKEMISKIEKLII